MPHPIDIAVGKNIRMYRHMKGMTQVQVAEKLGISFQQLQKYETGYNRISASKMWDVSKLLGVSVARFFAGIEDGPEDTIAVRDVDEAELLEVRRKMPANMRPGLNNVAKEMLSTVVQA